MKEKKSNTPVKASVEAVEAPEPVKPVEAPKPEAPRNLPSGGVLAQERMLLGDLA